MSPFKGGKKIELGGMGTQKRSTSKGFSGSFKVRICENRQFKLKDCHLGSTDAHVNLQHTFLSILWHTATN